MKRNKGRRQLEEIILLVDDLKRHDPPFQSDSVMKGAMYQAAASSRQASLENCMTAFQFECVITKGVSALLLCIHEPTSQIT